ncbi:uncharacterized protein LOC142379398 [Odontesthes bonariensis]|uniref:uncharacterized protein LOC142379398 n=1 Tax=Odontesthes bonariensis TaxID=219752 RepID=UPI003F58A634
MFLLILLVALSMVEAKTQIIRGRVGETVKVECSNFDASMSVTTNVKYLCNTPCNNVKHIIVKAAFQRTERKDRIQITNHGDILLVTFADLKLSDSKKYYCGVERYFWDSFEEVDLKVIDGGPKTIVATVPVGSTVTYGVPVTSTTSSRLDITTELYVWYNTLYTTPAAPTQQGAGYVPYLVVGSIVITSLIVILMFMRTLKRRPKMASSCPAVSSHDSAHVGPEHEDNRLEDQHTHSQTVPDLTVHFSAANTDIDQDSTYVNYSHLQALASIYDSVQEGACADTRVTDHLSDTVYSLAQPPKREREVRGKSVQMQPVSIENDFLYSLA